MTTACSSLDFLVPDVHFQPWQGVEYGGSTLGAKRLLVLGEAHYDDRPEYDVPQLTREVVSRQCDRTQPLPFFTKAAGLLAAASGGSASAVWPSVAFYNYIPMFAGTAPGQRPTDAMWRAAVAPFRAVIDTVAPARVLVLGVDVWNHLEIPKSVIAGLDPDQAIRRWRFDDGPEILATWIHHPSSVGFSPALWLDRVRRLLEAPDPDRDRP